MTEFERIKREFDACRSGYEIRRALDQTPSIQLRYDPYSTLDYRLSDKRTKLNGEILEVNNEKDNSIWNSITRFFRRDVHDASRA